MTKVETANDYQAFATTHSITKLDEEFGEAIEKLEAMSFDVTGQPLDPVFRRALRSVQLSFYALGVGGESGEVLDKVKKGMRGDYDIAVMPEENRRAIGLELGDALWYIANEAHQLGYTLTEIMQMNVDKLEDRRARGVSRGDGDNR